MSLSSSHGSTSSASSRPSINVEPIHQQQAHQPQGTLGQGAAKAPGLKEMLGRKAGLLGPQTAKGNYASPTDMMVSPCTQKLAASKKKHYTKGKPMGLSRSFQEAQVPGQGTPQKEQGVEKENEPAGEEQKMEA